MLLLWLFSIGTFAKVYFKETFEDETWSDRWVVSDWNKKEGKAGEWEWTAGKWSAPKANKGLKTTQDAKFYAISAKFKSTLDNKNGKDIVLQFAVKHEQKIDCGGGYVKLLRPDADQKNFKGDTEYAVMFGPDICGYSTKKTHVILTHKGENLLTKKDIKCEDDEFTHVYTLILKPDATYEVRIDGEKKESGELKKDWDFEKPQKIKDPKAKKPDDWVDDEMMDDPNDKKPDDWDKEPKEIPDPKATKPEDWDDEDDGEWEAPMIANPKYKGEWKPKKIKNPDYKGAWVHPEIDNPDYVEEKDVQLRGPIGGIGIEIWQVKAGTVFSNFIVTDDVKEAEEFLADTKVEKKDEEEAKKAVEDAKKAEEEKAKEDDKEEEVQKETETAKDMGELEDDEKKEEEKGKEEL